MADGAGSSSSASSSKDAKDFKEAKVTINVKTLDSQVYTFDYDVKKETTVSMLKEEIAASVGVPTGQQRLIFRGKVLKNDDLLSGYSIEDGDTLHLVVRQPVQSQNETRPEETQNTGTSGLGNDPTGSLPRARIGHSVLVGLNLADNGENTNTVNLSQIIGSVLNSLGVGTTNDPLIAGNASTNTASQNFRMGGQRSNANGRSGSQSSQVSSQLQRLQSMVIPDSLTTLSIFMTHMEHVLSLHSGHQMPTTSDSQRRTQNLSHHPSHQALLVVLERAQRLLSGHAATAISHLLGRLRRERYSTDVAVRGHLQAESLHVGVAMQQLGSLLLELGRTVSTLRVGTTPDESIVNSGPAVYISAHGPNPLMVQPVPQQNSHLFSVPLRNIINIGVPENVTSETSGNANISVNAGGGNSATTGVPLGSRVGSVETLIVRQPNQENAIQNSSSDSHTSQTEDDVQNGHTTSPSLRNFDPASQLEADRETVISEKENFQDVSQNTGKTLENKVLNNACESSGIVDSSLSLDSNINMSGASDQKNHPDSERDSSKSVGNLSIDSLRSSQSKKISEPVPLGLGLGGLSSKRLSRQPSHGKNAVSNDNGNQQLIAKGQEVLKSLVSQSSKSRKDTNETSASHDSSLGSSSGSRNPQLVRGQSQNIGGMLSGMIQQMMPVVSQALGVDPSKVPTSTKLEPGQQHQMMENGTSRNNMADGRSQQVNLQLVVDGIEREDSSRNIFQNVLEAAVQLCGYHDSELSDVLGNDEELINAFMEMMHRQLSLRLSSATKQTDKA